MSSKKNRPSFEAFKEKAIQRKEVKEEYNALMPIFELKNQMIKARIEANLSQEEVANILHIKKG